MGSKTWMKWLSGIALVVIVLSIIEGLWLMSAGEVVEVTGADFATFLLAIVAVIISFSKDKKK